MKEDRMRLFESSVILESFLNQYGEKYGDIENLLEFVPPHLYKQAIKKDVERGAGETATAAGVGYALKRRNEAKEIEEDFDLMEEEFDLMEDFDLLEGTPEEAAELDKQLKTQQGLVTQGKEALAKKPMFGSPKAYWKGASNLKKAGMVGAGAAALGGAAYLASKRRAESDSVVAFAKYGVKRFAESQMRRGVPRNIVVENIVENLREGMKLCSECDDPGKCRSKLANEIARVYNKNM